MNDPAKGGSAYLQAKIAFARGALIQAQAPEEPPPSQEAPKGEAPKSEAKSKSA